MLSYYDRAQFLLTHLPQDRLAEFFRVSPIGKTMVELMAVNMMAQDDSTRKKERNGIEKAKETPPTDHNPG
jgi:hypothetical protein